MDTAQCIVVPEGVGINIHMAISTIKIIPVLFKTILHRRLLTLHRLYFIIRIDLMYVCLQMQLAVSKFWHRMVLDAIFYREIPTINVAVIDCIFLQGKKLNRKLNIPRSE